MRKQQTEFYEQMCVKSDSVQIEKQTEWNGITKKKQIIKNFLVCMNEKRTSTHQNRERQRGKKMKTMSFTPSL